MKRNIKFICSEKATKFCEIFLLLLTVCTVVKSKGKISQNFVAFSEYMNFNISNHIKSLPLYQPLTEESTDVERARLTIIKFVEAVPTKGISAVSFSNHVKSTDVEFLDSARLTVIKFIEAIPTKGIPSVSFSNHIKSTDVEFVDNFNYHSGFREPVFHATFMSDPKKKDSVVKCLLHI